MSEWVMKERRPALYVARLEAEVELLKAENERLRKFEEMLDYLMNGEAVTPEWLAGYYALKETNHG